MDTKTTKEKKLNLSLEKFWRTFLEENHKTICEDRLKKVSHTKEEESLGKEELLHIIQTAELDSEVDFSLRTAMDELSFTDNNVIYGAFFKKMSLVDVAEKLKISPAAVRVVKLRALKKLRTILRSKGEKSGGEDEVLQ